MSFKEVNYLPSNLEFKNGVAHIGETSLLDVAKEYGTPLYVYDWEHLRDNIDYMKKRHSQGIRFFEQMAKYAPGFGLLGTLIGLIMMLAQLDDPATLGPSMSVALVTTFYGVLLSNLVFLPLAGRLQISSTEEVLQKEMFLEGVICISKEESGYLIREKMAMLLPEKERKKLQKAQGKK